jgi:hypothetical protein
MEFNVIIDAEGKILAATRAVSTRTFPRFEIHPVDSRHTLHNVTVPPELESFFNGTTPAEKIRSLKVEVVGGQAHLKLIG